MSPVQKFKLKYAPSLGAFRAHAGNDPIGRMKQGVEVASFHLGDNPGRREPGTGEINYKNIFP